MSADSNDTETTTTELKRKIRDAFDIFDHESNKTVDVREIGTIVRSLNCCPSEAELGDILNDIEEDEPTGYIRFEKFEPCMLRILLERKYRPATEEQLRKAFKVLDSAGNEFLSVEEIQGMVTEEGEPFTQEEMEEMLSAAVDPDKGVVYYNEYIPLMIVDDDGSW